MDALPVQEKNEVDYRSEKPGVMHACGHDGHMAILLVAARVLKEHRGDFPGNVKFVFQAGEEGYAGARLQIEEGALEDPEVHAALALHLRSDLPCGTVGMRVGPLMACMDSFRIVARGKGAHAALPEGGVDAILMSAHAIQSLQSLVSREVSPLTPLVVHVGRISGGEAFNIVAETVEMKGTVRTLDTALRKEVPDRMRRILQGIGSSFRGELELEYDFGYPVVENAPAVTELVRGAAVAVLGRDKVLEVPAGMMSDDMAFFLQKVPGCYFFVGAGNPGKGADQPHHNSRFNFDEAALTIGAEIMVRSTIDYLRGAVA
jgi:amidohydrolase